MSMSRWNCMVAQINTDLLFNLFWEVVSSNKAEVNELVL